VCTAETYSQKIRRTALIAGNNQKQGVPKMGLRDYGLPDCNPIGTPSWTPTDKECPNCNAKLCEVQVKVEQSLLKGGVGLCTYFGCPACPFASPALAVTINKEKEDG